MERKSHPKMKVSISPSVNEERSSADSRSHQNPHDSQTDAEQFESEPNVRQRHPGSSGRIIFNEGGWLVMRSERNKSPSEEIRAREDIDWPGHLSPQDEEKGRVKSNSPPLKVTKWGTADLHRGDNVTYIILAMKDFFLYAVYLTTLLLLIYGSHDNAYNYYARVASDVLTKSTFECDVQGLVTAETFETIKAKQHIWCFLDKVFLPFLYPENGTAKWVLLESILVGEPAMIQIRVKNGTCQTASFFEGVYKTCYDYYNDHSEDRSTFGFGEGYSAFRWRPGEVRVGARSLTGGFFSAPGGFQFDFTTDYNFTKGWLKELEDQVWIRQGTRYVVIDFTLYAPNTNLFLVSKLVFEVMPAGGIYTNSFFYTWRTLRYVGPWSVFLMSCEVLNIMFVLYFTFEEGVQIWFLGWEYLKNWWNILDWIIISLSYTSIIIAAWRLSYSFQVLADKLFSINTNVHANFNDLIYIQETYITAGAILLFFAWNKLFKFTTLFKSATLILTSIERVVPELIFMFYQAIIISIGFALFGQIMFGGHTIQFSTTTSSFFSMIGIYAGRMHFYRKCLKTHPILGPLYFASYIILVCMIHMNAFVAVIVHGYREACNLLNEKPGKQYFGDLVYNTVIQLLMRTGSDRLMRTLLAKDIVYRRQVDYDEFVLILKKHGVHGLQLRLLLAHYELKRGNELNFDQLLEIYNDLLLRHQLRIEAEGHRNAQELIQKTDRLLQSSTSAILDVQSKVDILIDKLLSDSAVEKKKEHKTWFTNRFF